VVGVLGRWSMAGIAGIPMRRDDQIIGVLNLYSAGPPEWSDRDVVVAGVLAEVATSYVVNASKLHQQGQLSEQLQQAPESWMLIEQAKGITAQQRKTPWLPMVFGPDEKVNSSCTLRARLTLCACPSSGRPATNCPPAQAFSLMTGSEREIAHGLLAAAGGP